MSLGAAFLAGSVVRVRNRPPLMKTISPEEQQRKRQQHRQRQRQRQRQQQYQDHYETEATRIGKKS